MRKVLFLLPILLTFLLPRPAFAVPVPICDPTQVDLNQGVRDPPCVPQGYDNLWWPKPTCANGQVACDLLTEVFCTKNELFLISWTGCWKKGTTVNLQDFKNTCDDGTTGVQSAIGCIQTGDLKEFLAFLMRFVIGISSAIILIMLVITGYNVLTSAGNPEKLAASKENLVALISGLILIVFSLVLLQVIGVDILKLPGF